MNEKISRAFANLDHPIKDERLAAADALVAMGSEAEPLLSAKLGSTRELKVRRRILLVLGQIKSPKAIPALMDYVQARDASTPDDSRALAMRAIIAALQPKHRKHCFDFFLELRRDPDPTVRSAALEGLAKLGDARAISFLEERSKSDEDPAVRERARALALTFTPVEVETDTYDLNTLVTKLASTDAFQRQMAIDNILQQYRDNARQIFIDAITAPHALARKSGIQGLGQLADPANAPLLLRLAADHHAHADERALALRGLAHLDPLPGDQRQNLATLAPLAKQRQDLFLAAAALRALGRVRVRDATDLLGASLSDPEGWIRESAAQAIEENISPSDQGLLPLITAALGSSRDRDRAARRHPGQNPQEERNLQHSLLRALNRLQATGDRALEAAQTITFYVLHPEADLRAEAWHFITHVASQNKYLRSPELEVIVDQLVAPEARDRRAALEVIRHALPKGESGPGTKLTEYAYSADREIRAAVAPLLARIGSQQAARALAKLTLDDDPAVAAAAREALEHAEGR